jgi:hypothetical protein
MLPLCTIHLFFGRSILIIVYQMFPIRSFHFHNAYPCLPSNSSKKKKKPRSPRLKNTLLPPRLPLLLPRSLTVPKRKSTRPLIRTRSLAHAARILSKQQRPSAKAEQCRIAHHPRRESKVPPAHQLRVKVERRHGLESHGHCSRSFAQLVARRLAGFARRRAGVFAAAAVALFAAARGRAGGK